MAKHLQFRRCMVRASTYLVDRLTTWPNSSYPHCNIMGDERLLSRTSGQQFISSRYRKLCTFTRSMRSCEMPTPCQQLVYVQPQWQVSYRTIEVLGPQQSSLCMCIASLLVVIEILKFRDQPLDLEHKKVVKRLIVIARYCPQCFPGFSLVPLSPRFLYSSQQHGKPHNGMNHLTNHAFNKVVQPSQYCMDKCAMTVISTYTTLPGS